MEALGESVLFLKTDDKGLVSGIDSAHKQSEKLDNQSKKTSKSFLDIGAKLSMVYLGLSSMLKKAGEGIKNFFGGAMDLEKNTIALETMLGSASKAQEMLKGLTKFGAETPFQLPGLIEASKKLIAFGIDSGDVIQKLKNLGNAAQGNQEVLDRLTNAYGKLKAKGKASLEELNIITEAGVPIIGALANQYKVSTGEMLKMISAGKIGFPQVDAALTAITTGTGQFAGMIEKQSKSLAGLISTLQDNITMITTSLAKPFLPVLKNLTSMGISLLGNVQKWIDDHEVQLANFAENLPEIFRIGFKAVTRIITQTFSAKGLASAFSAMGETFLATFQAALELLPYMVGKIFRVGGPLLEIITSNLFMGISEAVAKAFKVDVTKDKDYQEMQRVAAAAYSKLGEGLSDVPEKFQQVFTKWVGKVKDASKTLVDSYSGIINETKGELDKILNAPRAPIAPDPIVIPVEVSGAEGVPPVVEEAAKKAYTESANWYAAAIYERQRWMTQQAGLDTLMTKNFDSELEDRKKAYKQFTDTLLSYSSSMFTALGESIIAAVKGEGDAWKALADAALDTVARILDALGQQATAQAALAYAALNVPSGIAWTLAAAAAFTGAGIVRALDAGGTIQPGETALVGEKRPEFVTAGRTPLSVTSSRKTAQMLNGGYDDLTRELQAVELTKLYLLIKKAIQDKKILIPKGSLVD